MEIPQPMIIIPLIRGFFSSAFINKHFFSLLNLYFSLLGKNVQLDSHILGNNYSISILLFFILELLEQVVAISSYAK